LFRPRSPHHYLPRMQPRDAGVLRGFNPVRASTTSLACKSEPGVEFLGFRPRPRSPPPPSRASASRRRVIWGFHPIRAPPPPSHARASRRRCFISFQPRLRPHLLRHVQVRAGGGFLCGFDAVCPISTSLAHNSEPEVDFSHVSSPFAPFPPPSRQRIYLWLRPRSPHFYLPRVQRRAGGEVCGCSTPFTHILPPSRATASQRWVLRLF
jgi:hypothetical protein